MNTLYEKRIDKLRYYVEKNNYDGFLVNKADNINYLTGTDTIGCLIVAEDSFLLVPLLNYDLTKSKFENTITYFQTKIRDDPNLYEGKMSSALSNQLKKMDISKAFIDNSSIENKLKEFKLKKSEKIENMRIVKDSDEIKKIQKSNKITETIFSEIDFSDKTDRELTAELVYKARIKADDVAYEPIVASGKNTRYPHPKIIDQKLDKNHILVDFGTKYDGYCTDITRMYSKKNDVISIVKFLDNLIFELVDYIDVDMEFREIDKFIRDKLKLKNYDSYLTHSMGHGIGLNVHERPAIHKYSKDKVKNGMVFTIEPGIYLERYGIRIEKMIHIKNNKAKIICE